MATKIVRVSAGNQTTLSHLYIDDVFQCYLLENLVRDSKIDGITAIPEGDFQLRLNTSAGMNRGYSERFKGLHEGMIEIHGIPNFSFIFFHLGNRKEDTKGCPLTGLFWAFDGKEYGVFNSTHAYKFVYPKLLKLIKTGKTAISVINLADIKNSPI
jgi:hypothetical protein